MARTKNTQQKNGYGANVGFEAQLWQAADILRGVMVAAGCSSADDDMPGLPERDRQ